MTGFTLGLRARIAIALAVVLGVFIFVTEISISRVMTLSLGITAKDPAIRDALLSGRRLVLFYLSLGAVTTLAVGSVLLWRLAVRPLQRVTRAVEAVASGDLKVRAPAEGASELLDLGAAFNRMAETLQRQRTEIEHRIQEVEQSRADLATAQDRLIRAARLASVGTLAAGVAHEIGNPLAGLLGLLDALEHERDEDRARRFRELMRSELRRIDATISGLLAYARPASERDTEQASCIVEDVLDHTRTLLGAQKVFAQVALEVHGDEPQHMVAVPRDDLTQLFVNLLLNAAQAMEGTGLISVEISSRNRVVQIVVQDSGPGIPEHQAAKVFDPFFTTKPLGKGSGLGLAISQGICERWRGQIELDTGCSAGARFVVTLPLADIATDNPPV